MGTIPNDKDIAEMPIAKEDLRALFEYLDRSAMTGYACDHSFSLTTSFLQKHALPEATIIPWLREHGAGCDCEIMFNVAQDWEDVVDYTPLDEDDDDDWPPAEPKRPWWKFW